MTAETVGSEHVSNTRHVGLNSFETFLSFLRFKGTTRRLTEDELPAQRASLNNLDESSRCMSAAPVSI